MRVLTRVGVALLVVTGWASAETILLPGFAYRVPGAADNLWTSEVLVTNLGPEPMTIRLVDVLVGRKWLGMPCVPPETVALEVSPHSTAFWPALRLREFLGCPEALVGALVEVATPISFFLPPRSWRQFRIGPPIGRLTVCLDPEHFDLFLRCGGNCGSVRLGG